MWVPIIRSWALTRGFALHPGTNKRYMMRYTRNQDRLASRHVNDHGRVLAPTCVLKGSDDDDVEDRRHDPCCASDGGRSCGVAVQAEIPNHRRLRRSRAGVVSVAVDVSLLAGRVCDEKTNMCEPLLTHRNETTMASKLGSVGGPGQRPPRWVLSRGVGCMWPRRCPVYRWRELVAGAGMEQENLSPR